MTDTKHLTDKEFVVHIRQTWPRTSGESDALDRIEHLLDTVEDLEAECGELRQRSKVPQ